MLVRVVLVAAAGLAALLIDRDAPNFLVVEGILGIAIIAGVVLVVAALQRR